MSNAQIKNAVKHTECYALCEVNMSAYDLPDRYKVEDINKIEGLILFINSIGNKLTPLIENAISVENNIDSVKLTNDYRAIVPQSLIKNNGQKLEKFVDELIMTLKLLKK